MFSRMSRMLGVIGLASLACLIPACNKGSQTTTSGKAKVAVVTNCTAEFWSIAEAGANKSAKDNDVEVIFRQPLTNTVADQMDIVKDLLKVGVSGVAVSVIKPDEQAASLQGIAKKVNLITMDNDATGSGRICYIGVDNYEAGKAVGRLVKKGMPNGGTVALFIGTTSSANSKDRIGGVIDELADKKGAAWDSGSMAGKFKIDGIYTDDTDETKAQDKAKDVLEKLKGTPNIVMVGLYAYNPKAILLAAKAKGLAGKVAIAGFDEDNMTLKGIEDGEILGTVVQDPFNYGYKSVEILAALAKGDKSKGVDYNIPYRVITKAGAPDETVNGVKVVTMKASDFSAKLAADLASVKK
jgi:ribose transport system substrate-binding protein